MKRSLLSPLAVIMVAGVILAGCGKGVAPSPTPVQQPAATTVAKPPTGADWEERWNTTLAAAKKEGSVMIYTDWPSDLRLGLGKAFSARYGIALEFATFGTSSELTVKAEAERRAGLKLVDVLGQGAGASATQFVPKGLVAPMRPILMLPEVLDPNAWLVGKLPFVDAQDYHIAMIASPFRTVCYNTTLVKKGELTTYLDLLKPQYKGKIAWNDPSATGNLSIAFLMDSLWGEAKTKDFVTRLLKEQGAVISREKRIPIEETAKGKYSIVFGPSMTTIPAFIEAQAPLDFADVAEDVRLSSGGGGMDIAIEPAHPNAAAIFVNWMLTKEGQSVFVKGFGMPSGRLDASMEGVSPLLLRVPGKKYLPESGAFYENQGPLLEKIGAIIQEASK